MFWIANLFEFTVFTDTVASYKTLREKLAAKMKKRRSEERLKRQVGDFIHITIDVSYFHAYFL